MKKLCGGQKTLGSYPCQVIGENGSREKGRLYVCTVQYIIRYVYSRMVGEEFILASERVFRSLLGWSSHKYCFRLSCCFLAVFGALISIEFEWSSNVGGSKWVSKWRNYVMSYELSRSPELKSERNHHVDFFFLWAFPNLPLSPPQSSLPAPIPWSTWSLLSIYPFDGSSRPPPSRKAGAEESASSKGKGHPGVRTWPEGIWMIRIRSVRLGCGVGGIELPCLVMRFCRKEICYIS